MYDLTDNLGMPEDENTWRTWYASLSDHEKTQLITVLAGAPTAAPVPGPQMMAYRSPAHFLGYGGAAGGMKTGLLCLLILYGHNRSVIFRPNADECSALVDNIQRWYGSSVGRNNQDKIFRFADKPGHMMEWGGLVKPNAELAWQGREHDLVGFDEMALLAKAKVIYVTAWNRTTSDQRTRIVGTFNPPGGLDGMDVTGMWVIDFFAPWISQSHPFPAESGEIRYFLPSDNLDDDENEIEVSSPDPVHREVGGVKLVIQPQPRSFIFSKVTDNPFIDPSYVSTLYQLEPMQRERMLAGSFKTTGIHRPNQVCPTDWVDAAMKRWTPAGRQKPQSSLGVDVAGGGSAFSCFVRRHEWWWDKVKRIRGALTPLGSDVAMAAIKENTGGAVICVDANGIGSGAYEALLYRRQNVIPLKGTEQKSEFARKLQKIYTMAKFANVRSGLHWAMHKLLDPDTGLEPALPNDNRLRQQLITPTYELNGKWLQVQTKESVQDELGYSPDDLDCVLMSLGNMFSTPGFNLLLPNTKRPDGWNRIHYSDEERRVVSASDYARRNGSLRGYGVRSGGWMAR